MAVGERKTSNKGKQPSKAAAVKVNVPGKSNLAQDNDTTTGISKGRKNKKGKQPTQSAAQTFQDRARSMFTQALADKKQELKAQSMNTKFNSDIKKQRLMYKFQKVIEIYLQNLASGESMFTHSKDFQHNSRKSKVLVKESYTTAEQIGALPSMPVPVLRLLRLDMKSKTVFLSEIEEVLAKSIAGINSRALSNVVIRTRLLRKLRVELRLLADFLIPKLHSGNPSGQRQNIFEAISLSTAKNDIVPIEKELPKQNMDPSSDANCEIICETVPAHTGYTIAIARKSSAKKTSRKKSKNRVPIVDAVGHSSLVWVGDIPQTANGVVKFEPTDCTDLVSFSKSNHTFNEDGNNCDTMEMMPPMESDNCDTMEMMPPMESDSMLNCTEDMPASLGTPSKEQNRLAVKVGSDKLLMQPLPDNSEDLFVVKDIKKEKWEEYDGATRSFRSVFDLAKENKLFEGEMSMADTEVKSHVINKKTGVNERDVSLAPDSTVHVGESLKTVIDVVTLKTSRPMRSILNYNKIKSGLKSLTKISVGVKAESKPVASSVNKMSNVDPILETVKVETGVSICNLTNREASREQIVECSSTSRRPENVNKDVSSRTNDVDVTFMNDKNKYSETDGQCQDLTVGSDNVDEKPVSVIHQVQMSTSVSEGSVFDLINKQCDDIRRNQEKIESARFSSSPVAELTMKRSSCGNSESEKISTDSVSASLVKDLKSKSDVSGDDNVMDSKDSEHISDSLCKALNIESTGVYPTIEDSNEDICASETLLDKGELNAGVSRSDGIEKIGELKEKSAVDLLVSKSDTLAPLAENRDDSDCEKKEQEVTKSTLNKEIALETNASEDSVDVDVPGETLSGTAKGNSVIKKELSPNSEKIDAVSSILSKEIETTLETNDKGVCDIVEAEVKVDETLDLKKEQSQLSDLIQKMNSRITAASDEEVEESDPESETGDDSSSDSEDSDEDSSSETSEDLSDSCLDSEDENKHEDDKDTRNDNPTCDEISEVVESIDNLCRSVGIAITDDANGKSLPVVDSNNILKDDTNEHSQSPRASTSTDTDVGVSQASMCEAKEHDVNNPEVCDNDGVDSLPVLVSANNGIKTSPLTMESDHANSTLEYGYESSVDDQDCPNLVIDYSSVVSLSEISEKVIERSYAPDICPAESTPFQLFEKSNLKGVKPKSAFVSDELEKYLETENLDIEMTNIRGRLKKPQGNAQESGSFYILPDVDDIDGIPFLSFSSEALLKAHISIEQSKLLASGLTDLRSLKDKGNTECRKKYENLLKSEISQTNVVSRITTNAASKVIQKIHELKKKYDLKEAAVQLTKVGKLHWKTEESLFKNMSASEFKNIGLDLRRKRRKNLTFTHRKSNSQSRLQAKSRSLFSHPLLKSKILEKTFDSKSDNGPKSSQSLKSLPNTYLSAYGQSLKKFRSNFKRLQNSFNRNKKPAAAATKGNSTIGSPHTGTTLEHLQRKDELTVVITKEQAEIAVKALRMDLIKCDQPECRFSCICHLMFGKEAVTTDEPETIPCTKQFCKLGCICSSLTHAGSDGAQPKHCGKPECMLKCQCGSREVPGKSTDMRSEFEQQSRRPVQCSTKHSMQAGRSLPQSEQPSWSHSTRPAQSSATKVSGSLPRPKRRRIPKVRDDSLIYYDAIDFTPPAKKQKVSSSKKPTLDESIDSVARNAIQSHGSVNRHNASVCLSDCPHPGEMSCARIRPFTKSASKRTECNCEEDSPREQTYRMESIRLKNTLTNNRAKVMAPAISSFKQGTAKSSSTSVPVNVIPQKKSDWKRVTQMMLLQRTNAQKRKDPGCQPIPYLLEVSTVSEWSEIQQQLFSLITRLADAKNGYPDPCIIMMGSYKVEIEPPAKQPVAVPAHLQKGGLPSLMYSIRVSVDNMNTVYERFGKTYPEDDAKNKKGEDTEGMKKKKKEVYRVRQMIDEKTMNKLTASQVVAMMKKRNVTVESGQGKNYAVSGPSGISGFAGLKYVHTQDSHSLHHISKLRRVEIQGNKVREQAGPVKYKRSSCPVEHVSAKSAETSNEHTAMEGSATDDIIVIDDENGDSTTATEANASSINSGIDEGGGYSGDISSVADCSQSPGGNDKEVSNFNPITVGDENDKSVITKSMDENTKVGDLNFKNGDIKARTTTEGERARDRDVSTRDDDAKTRDKDVATCVTGVESKNIATEVLSGAGPALQPPPSLASTSAGTSSHKYSIPRETKTLNKPSNKKEEVKYVIPNTPIPAQLPNPLPPESDGMLAVPVLLHPMQKQKDGSIVRSEFLVPGEVLLKPGSVLPRGCIPTGPPKVATKEQVLSIKVGLPSNALSGSPLMLASGTFPQLSRSTAPPAILPKRSSHPASILPKPIGNRYVQPKVAYTCMKTDDDNAVVSSTFSFAVTKSNLGASSESSSNSSTKVGHANSGQLATGSTPPVASANEKVSKTLLQSHRSTGNLTVSGGSSLSNSSILVGQDMVKHNVLIGAPVTTGNPVVADGPFLNNSFLSCKSIVSSNSTVNKQALVRCPNESVVLQDLLGITTSQPSTVKKSVPLQTEASSAPKVSASSALARFQVQRVTPIPTISAVPTSSPLPVVMASSAPIQTVSSLLKTSNSQAMPPVKSPNQESPDASSKQPMALDAVPESSCMVVQHNNQKYLLVPKEDSTVPNGNPSAVPSNYQMIMAPTKKVDKGPAGKRTEGPTVDNKSPSSPKVHSRTFKNRLLKMLEGTQTDKTCSKRGLSQKDPESNFKEKRILGKRKRKPTKPDPWEENKDLGWLSSKELKLDADSSCTSYDAETRIKNTGGKINLEASEADLVQTGGNVMSDTDRDDQKFVFVSDDDDLYDDDDDDESYDLGEIMITVNEDTTSSEYESDDELSIVHSRRATIVESGSSDVTMAVDDTCEKEDTEREAAPSVFQSSSVTNVMKTCEKLSTTNDQKNTVIIDSPDKIVMVGLDKVSVESSAKHPDPSSLDNNDVSVSEKLKPDVEYVSVAPKITSKEIDDKPKELVLDEPFEDTDDIICISGSAPATGKLVLRHVVKKATGLSAQDPGMNDIVDNISRSEGVNETSFDQQPLKKHSRMADTGTNDYVDVENLERDNDDTEVSSEETKKKTDESSEEAIDVEIVEDNAEEEEIDVVSDSNPSSGNEALQFRLSGCADRPAPAACSLHNAKGKRRRKTSLLRTLPEPEMEFTEQVILSHNASSPRGRSGSEDSREGSLALHNVRERERRRDMMIKMLLLKSAVYNKKFDLGNIENISKVKAVTDAANVVEQLQKSEEELLATKAALMKHNVVLTMRLKSLQEESKVEKLEALKNMTTDVIRVEETSPLIVEEPSDEDICIIEEEGEACDDVQIDGVIDIESEFSVC